MLIVKKTDIGLARQKNEDSFLVMEPDLFAVADGMGGHLAGEVASSLALDFIKEHIKKYLAHNDPESGLHGLLEGVNNYIYNQAMHDEHLNGMGTTLTLAYIEEKTMFFAHVGDSRIYLYREDNLVQLTEDHSLVHELLKNKLINEQEANTHPRKNILTRAIGIKEYMEIDTGKLELKADDIIVLATDGLTNMVSDEEMANIIAKNILDFEMLGTELLAQAKFAGGKDNITFVCIKIEQ